MNSDSSHNDHITLAVSLVSTGIFFISLQSAIGKFLGTSYHAIELIFYRNLIILLAIALYLKISGNWNLVHTSRLSSHIKRGLAGTVGVVLFIWSLFYLPLPDATTLGFTLPFFVILLAYPMLGEKVGPARIMAVIIGFLGVIIVVKPSGDALPFIGVCLALGGALFNGLVQIFLRDLGKTEHPLTTVFHFMLWGTLATGLMLPFVWTGPKWADLLLILIFCLVAGLQQIIKTKGYALAPVSLLSPLNYTSLIWAMIFGWLIWRDIPTLNMLLGSCVIITSNLFILWRERENNNE